ncbi:MAG: hypothetical protein KBA31_19635 [Alphaproteobacteria bacterium]|nr:hypothetical protein [Alphaproteobacteria bacterium]
MRNLLCVLVFGLIFVASASLATASAGVPAKPTVGVDPETAGCSAVVMSGDAAALRRYLATFRDLPNPERSAAPMSTFRHCIKARGLAVLRDRKTVMVLAGLLDVWFLTVQTAYLLGDLGSSARPALPKMKALLAAQPDPADENGFVFMRDALPVGALENAIAQIEQSSD